jgi:hypothetical protein
MGDNGAKIMQSLDKATQQYWDDIASYIDLKSREAAQAANDNLSSIRVGSATYRIASKNVHDSSDGYASGTDYVPQTGTYMVGEQGPERVVLPRGAAVIPNDQLGRGGSGWGGGGSKQPVHIHVDVGSRELASVLVDDIMDLAAREVRVRHGRRVF